jgi:WD40 repeat protein
MAGTNNTDWGRLASPPRELKGHRDDVTCVSFLNVGERRAAVSGSRDGNVIEWNLDTGEAVRTSSVGKWVHSVCVMSASASSERGGLQTPSSSPLVVAGCAGGDIVILRDGQILHRETRGHQDDDVPDPQSVIVSEVISLSSLNGLEVCKWPEFSWPHMLSVGFDGMVRCWEVNGMILERRARRATGDTDGDELGSGFEALFAVRSAPAQARSVPVCSVALIPALPSTSGVQASFVTGDSNSGLSLHSSNGTVLSRFDLSQGEVTSVYAVSVFPDGIVAGCDDRIRIVSFDGDVRHVIDPNGPTIAVTVPSFDVPYAIVGGTAGLVQVISTELPFEVVTTLHNASYTWIQDIAVADPRSEAWRLEEDPAGKDSKQAPPPVILALDCKTVKFMDVKDAKRPDVTAITKSANKKD